MKTSSINKREKDVINENQNKIEECDTKNPTLGTTCVVQERTYRNKLLQLKIFPNLTTNQ